MALPSLYNESLRFDFALILLLCPSTVMSIDSSLGELVTTEPVDLSESRLAKAYNDLGVTFLRQSQFEQAIAHFKQAIALAAGLPMIDIAKLHYNVGLVELRLGHEAEAVRQFEAALQQVPEFAPATYQLFRMGYERQNRDRGYEFNQDWFSRNILILQTALQRFVDQPNLHVLEIGSWEGRSTCWFLTHVLTHDAARMTCVDTFGGSEEHYALFDAAYLSNIEARFDQNIARTGVAHKVMKHVGASNQVLRSLPAVATFDLIYIDGSHWSDDVLTDAVLSWELLKLGGYMIFDDYDGELRFPQQHTKVGIDAFMAAFHQRLQGIHQSHIVIVEKTERVLK